MFCNFYVHAYIGLTAKPAWYWRKSHLWITVLCHISLVQFMGIIMLLCVITKVRHMSVFLNGAGLAKFVFHANLMFVPFQGLCWMWISQFCFM